MSELGHVDSEGRLVCYCGALMVARESDHGPFFGCDRWPNCEGLVGAHKKTGEPLGLPAPKWVRSIRNQLHEQFDQLWKGRSKHARSAAYAWLAEALGITSDECHIGRFDSELCLRAMEAIAKRRPEAGLELKVVEIRVTIEQQKSGLVQDWINEDDIPF